MARKPAKKVVPFAKEQHIDLYGVKLLRNYMPRDMSGKRWKGEELLLPKEDAEWVIEHNIGVRNDPYTPSN
jgi:hypothetical protein